MMAVVGIDCLWTALYGAFPGSTQISSKCPVRLCGAELFALIMPAQLLLRSLIAAETLGSFPSVVVREVWFSSGSY